MFSSMCSLKSSTSPRSSLTNLPSSKPNHLLSTFQKQNHQYFLNDNIHIKGFQSIASNRQDTFNSLKSSLGQRSGSQETFAQAIKDKLSFQKKQLHKQRLNRFKSNEKEEKISRLGLVKSVDGFNMSVPHCSNLDGKKAKYYVVGSKEHQNKVYCSKCSIMFLQKGLQITQIQQSEHLFPNSKLTSSISSQNTNHYRAQLQQLTVKLNRLQADMKSQISNLERNYFFLTIQQSKEKIQETYNKILELIFKMKQSDLNELRLAKEQILKQTQNQKRVLTSSIKSIESSKNQIFNLTRKLPMVDQRQYKYHVKEALMTIESNKRYESLEFKIKEQNQERMIQRIVEEIKGKLLKAVEFSFDNFRKDWNFEECEVSFSDGVRESFRGILKGYQDMVVPEQQNEQSVLN